MDALIAGMVVSAVEMIASAEIPAEHRYELDDER